MGYGLGSRESIPEAKGGIFYYTVSITSLGSHLLQILTLSPGGKGGRGVKLITLNSRVPVYRSRGPGSIPGATRFSD
jgi:hypothetical protein